MVLQAARSGSKVKMPVERKRTEKWQATAQEASKRKKRDSERQSKKEFDVDRIRTCESRAHEEVLEACTSRLNHSATTSSCMCAVVFC